MKKLVILLAMVMIAGIVQAQYRNSEGGNLFGDSDINPMADPDINPMADPDINPDADPDINPYADPDIAPMGDPNYNSETGNKWGE